MDIYERAYPRLVYNGEIYDERSDQVAWDGRRHFDPGNGSLTSLEYVRSREFIANVRFLSEQNRIYLGLAETALTEVDALVKALPGSFKPPTSEDAKASPRGSAEACP